MATAVMRLLLLVAYLASALAGAKMTRLPLTKSFVTGTVAPAIKNMITNWPKKAIMGSIVRLTFHDCAGSDGCNGCLNTSLPDNAGLDTPIKALEDLYQSMSLSLNMSRADFWALSGIVAVGVGMKRGPSNLALPASLDPRYFKYGRQDCDTSPLSITDKSSDFPSAMLGSAGVTSYFSKRFNFKAQETVAIMGAHHLGRMHQEYSGFNGAWVPSQTMDGQYYRNLLNVSANWHQKVVNCSVRPYDLKVQWVDNRGPPCLNMLDADIALYKNIGTPLSTGAVSCTYQNCPFATATKDTVVQYANNAADFQNAFAAVYDVMLSVSSHAANGFPSMYSLTPVA